MLESALQYAGLGMAVLPLLPRSKLPVFKSWPETASKDPTLIQRWWKQEPNYNIGIATGAKSNVFVVDVDPKNGGNETWEDLVYEHGRPPETWTDITGSGGLHLYFRLPNFSVRNHVNLWSGIDIRGDGGQVVAPPSIHPDTGNEYAWDGLRDIAEQPIAEAPAWILEKLEQDRAKPAGSAIKNGLSEIPLKIPQGCRHYTLLSLAGILRRMGLSPNEIYPTLQIVNQTRCEVPKPEADIRKLAESMARYQPGDRNLYSVSVRVWSILRKFENEQSDAMDRMGPIDAISLLKKPLQEPDQVLDGVLHTGLTILAGRPKQGKSWCTLQMAIAIATGADFMGRIKVLKPGRVGYFALEESENRTSTRLRKLVCTNSITLQNIEFMYHIRPLFSGGQQDLEAYLEKVHPEVVVIDTLLALVGNKKRNDDVLRRDYNEIDVLRALSHKYNCAILVVHHMRKDSAGQGLDAVAGTTGITAAADCIWTLQRQTDGRSALDVIGREVEASTYLIKLDLNGPAPGWQVLEAGEDVHLSDERRDILELLSSDGPLKPSKIAGVLRKNEVTVRRLLMKMLNAGIVYRNSDGAYRVGSI